jgi:uncharacterized protein YtpQ (UPF0354 family)
MTAKRTAGHDALVALMTKLVKAEAGVASVTANKKEFALKVKTKSGDNVIIYLENMFAETREMSPRARETFLAERVKAFFQREPEESWDDVAEHLIPTLRGAAFGIGVVAQAKKARAPSTIRRPFVPFVDVHLAIDSETSIRYVTDDKPRSWGITIDQAFARAIENARDSLTEPVAYDDTNGPIYHVDRDDDYQSSRLVVPGLLASFADRVEGRPIAIIPERSQLFIGGDQRDDLVLRMIEMAEREWDASQRAISPALYTVDDAGTVVPYYRDGALAHRVRMGHARLALQEYAYQKHALDAIHERDGVDLFVATLNGLVRNDGRPITWCLWAEGIESSLPEADVVAIDGGPEKKRWSFHVPFRIVRETMGDTFEPDAESSPQRFRPRKWPNKKQLAALRDAAVELEDL